MVQKIVMSGFFIAFSATAFSQDSSSIDEASKSLFSIHGSGDAYYKYDFAKTASNGKTSFTQMHNKFELGMASAVMEYQTSKTHMVLDIGFGKRAEDFSYSESGILQAVKQAYISYTPTANLTLTAGSWATHIGFELLDAYQNRNYSMSYMFSTGPFSNTGVKAEYCAGKNNFMLGVTNPTDYKYVPDNVINKKFVIAQYHFNGGEAFSLCLNYTGGEWVDTSKINQIDMVIASRFSKQFGIGINSTVGFKKLWIDQRYSGSKTWWGAALYLNGDLTNHFGLTLREEYFDDKDAVTCIPIGGHVIGSTLSANFKVDNLVFIPEIRIDAASQPVFLKSNGNPTKTNVNALLAIAYNF